MFLQKKQLSPEIRAILDSVGVSPLLLAMTRHLSACGWQWQPSGHVWAKGGHYIAEKDLDIIAKYWPAMWPPLKEHFIRGAVGFEIDHGETEDGNYRATLRAKWPSAVEVVSGAGEARDESRPAR